MEFAENIVLATSVMWVVWQVLTLRNTALHGGTIMPPEITSLLIFIVFIILIDIQGNINIH